MLLIVLRMTMLIIIVVVRRSTLSLFLLLLRKVPRFRSSWSRVVRLTIRLTQILMWMSGLLVVLRETLRSGVVSRIVLLFSIVLLLSLRMRSPRSLVSVMLTLLLLTVAKMVLLLKRRLITLVVRLRR